MSQNRGIYKEVTGRNHEHDEALFAAVKIQDPEARCIAVEKVLKELKPNVNARDGNGISVLEHAQATKDEYVQLVLRSHGASAEE